MADGRTRKKIEKISEKIPKSPLRFSVLRVYSYLSMAMSQTTLTAGSLLSEKVEAKTKIKNFQKSP